MNEEDVVLSDVHLRGSSVPGATPISSATSPPLSATSMSTFEYKFDAESSDEDESIDERKAMRAPFKGCESDAEGDACVRRRRRSRRARIHVQHSLETPLRDVGLQVWRGALVLGDFLEANQALVRGATVLELGCGCALSGLVAAKRAGHVFMTDAPLHVLANAECNAELNLVHEKCSVRQLDWCSTDTLLHGLRRHARHATSEGAPQRSTVDPAGSDEPADCRRYSWREADYARLTRCTLVLGADVVYDLPATGRLVKLLCELLLLLPPGACALVALERRINFHMPSLSVRATAAEYFAARLAAEAGASGILHASRIPLNFAQRFQYERVKELDLWLIQRKEGNTLASIARIAAPAAEERLRASSHFAPA
uniref:Calmodulin-lysine N-methyltransferase n=1 Tax=Coccolithus braarudii TaxID=221442 RepID=A0A7S0PV32_9EUKA|mmetsp:Transcript_14916/g.32356  ORF Transcript_14916/g.32356 Transcript_14916/m.32356 type:complete len:371 (+) Transcript_14916:80-1192(+)